ncbi:hypothetical protein SNE40_005054 [Patella caerulea]|uniref:Uncharacterized protein n=1 Tax=Patella caerulea TaxID=87958 RepID=A0AAN8PXY0_PATCE
MVIVFFLLAILCGSQAAAPTFSSAKILSTVKDKHVDEASGLAASRVFPGVVYTQNDKGGSNRIFAINSKTGVTEAELKISGVTNYDWEDLAIGPCGSHSCVYIAETGDHAGDGSRNIIYRVREPKELTSQTLDVDGEFHFTWNEPDCETVMVTPNEDIYVVSKVDGGNGLIAKFSNDGWTKGTTAKIVASARLSQTSSHNDPVGGDISADGKEMLIKYRDHVYYWDTSDGDYIGAISRKPADLPYTHEKRGESVCWDPRSAGYYTLGEGSHRHVYYYERTSPIIG